MPSHRQSQKFSHQKYSYIIEVMMRRRMLKAFLNPTGAYTLQPYAV